MTWVSDIKTVCHLVVSPIRGETHQDRLESFYGAQAEGYDGFRKRLLKGREELISSLPLTPGGTWVDLGGGTGANLEFAGERLNELQVVQVVDLSPSLLSVCRDRIGSRGWKNVEAVQFDATQYAPKGLVDVVTFSYSLTMIPDWYAAIENAWKMLKPGGTLGVVDFYVSRKYPIEGMVQHGPVTRGFWPAWFSRDNVFLSADHLPVLRAKFETVLLKERRAKLPFLPVGRAPYYLFQGRKAAG